MGHCQAGTSLERSRIDARVAVHHRGGPSPEINVTHHAGVMHLNLFFSWTFEFVIDNFSRFRKRLGRC
jgi:hypothetical protein